jgi:hypothetical protein
MLSLNENRVKELLETRLTGNHKEEALLYHSSVPRKLKAVQLFYNNITSFTPSFFTTATVSTSASPPNPPPSPPLIDAASLIDDISAYIDAFFMSGKSTLDSFAHELRSLYQFTGLTGDLYFENALDQLSRNHSTSDLNAYFTSCNIRNLDWFKDLNNYRRACAHESIIPFRPSFDFDVTSGRWLNPILKLPLNPGTYPPAYADKDFYQTGQSIKEGLNEFIINSYNHVLTDILDGRTRVLP